MALKLDCILSHPTTPQNSKKNKKNKEEEEEKSWSHGFCNSICDFYVPSRGVAGTYKR
jgi:hypothetical protein